MFLGLPLRLRFHRAARPERIFLCLPPVIQRVKPKLEVPL